MYHIFLLIYLYASAQVINQHILLCSECWWHGVIKQVQQYLYHEKQNVNNLASEWSLQEAPLQQELN